jgi:OHCU decarboxylase
MISREDFVSRFGGIFEHSPFIAERAYDAGTIIEPLSAATVHAAMAAAFQTSSREERLGVLNAHPDLAGKLAISGGLTEDSRKEQAGAGLDRLTPAEHARFTELNTAYMQKFGFPFIIAVKGLTKDDILQAFEARIGNSVEQEFETAAGQVERIARLRLEALFASA